MNKKEQHTRTYLKTFTWNDLSRSMLTSIKLKNITSNYNAL